jgi:hypothetical protein
MRFDNASHVEDVVWLMRLADLPRGENRTILNQLYNGDPPFDEALAEENNIEINRNTLSGVNLLAQARRQWNQAFLTSENYFTVKLDSGPPTKRREWGHIITKHVNRYLKESRKQMEEKRATGGNVMLHGVAPCTWNDRRSVIARPLPVSSVLTPSETEIDFDNLAYMAMFREWTPSQLYSLTHGPRVDPGWNMDLVKSQLKYVGEQVQKQPNATAYQYMPERIEELVKQDMGFWGSDAVPTIDVWDFFFREADHDGKGWYRRTILDWGVAEGLTKDSPKPKHPNEFADGKFLYSSGKRKYANSINEILHCQFADCSAVFPQRIHSVRSLGWMLWGVCDLENRLDCKFNEAVFEQLMWFFRVASNQDIARLKRANFMHMGAIPAGIDWVKSNERFTPDMPLIQLAFNRNRGKMNDAAASFSQDFDRERGSREMTATETMARVNSVNALVSGMLTLAYNYEDEKHREQCRRITIPNNPDPIAKKIITGCLMEGVPSMMINSERWIVQSERVLGAGNKTLGLAQAQFLQSVRKNLGPDAQRQVDHIAIEANTDDPALAEQLAPVAGMKVATNSMHDAQLSTERLMRGLPLVPRPDMVYSDYVMVWLADLKLMVGRAAQTNTFTPEDILGWETMSKQIQDFLRIIATNDEEKPKIKAWANDLKNTMNIVKKLAVILQQKQGAEGSEVDKVEIAKIQLEKAKAEQKMRERQQSHAARTAQRQVQFDLEQQREDRRTNADIRRENAKAAHELVRNRMTTFAE